VGVAGRKVSVTAIREISYQTPSIFSRTSLFQKRRTVMPLLRNTCVRRSSFAWWRGSLCCPPSTSTARRIAGQ